MSTVPTTAAPDGRQAAVSDAARRLYDAEVALHIARQTGVAAWISAACDGLNEEITDHTAALGSAGTAAPPAAPAATSPAGTSDSSRSQARGGLALPRLATGHLAGRGNLIHVWVRIRHARAAGIGYHNDAQIAPAAWASQRAADRAGYWPPSRPHAAQAGTHSAGRT